MLGCTECFDGAHPVAPCRQHTHTQAEQKVACVLLFFPETRGNERNNTRLYSLPDALVRQDVDRLKRYREALQDVYQRAAVSTLWHQSVSLCIVRTSMTARTARTSVIHFVSYAADGRYR